MSLIRICSIPFLAILLGSCAGAPTGPPKLVAAVTHHHDFGPQNRSNGKGQANIGSGEGVRFVAWGDAQNNNLRHGTYRILIEAKLQASGFRVENDPKIRSRYIARFRYWDSGSRVRTSIGTTTATTYGQPVDVNGTFIWLPGTTVEVPVSRSVTTYIRNLIVEIFDTNDMKIRSSSKHKSPKKIFEGYVVSEGNNPSVHDVIKSLIDAMFQSFPGPNGKRRVVKVIFSR